MPNIPIYEGLIRVNLSIEEKLHRAAIARARELKLDDGFSGLVSRLLIRDVEQKKPNVAKLPRRFKKK